MCKLVNPCPKMEIWPVGIEILRFLAVVGWRAEGGCIYQTLHPRICRGAGGAALEGTMDICMLA